MKWLQKEQSSALDSGYALVAALCEEDPTHETSSTLTLSFELNPEKLSCLQLDWATQRHYQLDEVAALLMVDPMQVLGLSGLGFHQVLAGEEDKEALMP